MKGIDRAARQMARLAGWAIDESLAKLFPPPNTMTSQQLVDYLTTLEEREEVTEPCHCSFGSPLLPWELLNDCCTDLDDEADPSTGAAGPHTPQPSVDGAGGRHLEELTWVLTVVLRRHLSKNLGLAGAVAPVVAKAAATELLHHFDVERRHP